MKTFIIRTLQLLVSRPSTFLKLKDTVFCNVAEPFFRLTAYAHRNKSHLLHLPILDIGAANGDTAQYFSRQFPKAPVIGFEPIPEMFHVAQNKNKNRSLVTIRNLALYDSIGKKKINITANSVSSSINELNAAEIGRQSEIQQGRFSLIEKLEVNTSTLDEETKDLKEILLIKIDTQGSELNILKSGIETLKKTHLILIEMNNHELYHNGCQYYEVDAFLRAQQFKLVDMILVFRPDGVSMEYDAIYERLPISTS
jgi:FkbM family methyltransferase